MPIEEGVYNKIAGILQTRLDNDTGADKQTKIFSSTEKSANKKTAFIKACIQYLKSLEQGNLSMLQGALSSDEHINAVANKAIEANKQALTNYINHDHVKEFQFQEKVNGTMFAEVQRLKHEKDIDDIKERITEQITKGVAARNYRWTAEELDGFIAVSVKGIMDAARKDPKIFATLNAKTDIDINAILQSFKQTPTPQEFSAKFIHSARTYDAAAAVNTQKAADAVSQDEAQKQRAKEDRKRQEEEQRRRQEEQKRQEEEARKHREEEERRREQERKLREEEGWKRSMEALEQGRLGLEKNEKLLVKTEATRAIELRLAELKEEITKARQKQEARPGGVTIEDTATLERLQQTLSGIEIEIAEMDRQHPETPRHFPGTGVLWEQQHAYSDAAGSERLRQLPKRKRFGEPPVMGETEQEKLERERALAKARTMREGQARPQQAWSPVRPVEAEGASEDPVEVFFEHGNTVVLPAMRKYAEKQPRKPKLIDLLRSDNFKTTHAESMHAQVKKAIEDAEGRSIEEVQPTISNGATTYEHNGKTLINTTEDKDGKVTFQVDPHFSGILRVERMVDGKPDPTQEDAMEYQNGKLIAVCEAPKGESMIKDIVSLKARAEISINNMEHPNRVEPHKAIQKKEQRGR